jgi:predicted transcriptional regulator
VPVRKSIHPDYLICLEDGAKLKMLKRYLRTTYGMTPDEYRAKWRLPTDYPMVAPNYAKQRSELAKSTGLGLRKSAPVPEPTAVVAAASDYPAVAAVRRGRKAKAATSAA